MEASAVTSFEAPKAPPPRRFASLPSRLGPWCPWSSLRPEKTKMTPELQINHMKSGKRIQIDKTDLKVVSLGTVTVGCL